MLEIGKELEKCGYNKCPKRSRNSQKLIELGYQVA